MQNKVVHAAERKAFSTVIDAIIKAGSGEDREKNIQHLVDMATKLLKDSVPGAAKGIHTALYPGSKWEQWIFRVIDETDPNILKTAVLNGAYEAAFRGYRDTIANAEKLQCNVPWIVIFDPTSACNTHCVGCWAADYERTLNLSFDEMDRLVTEAKALGTHLFMLTGGEPLVRKRDVLKLAEKHNDCLFNIFTNASLIDQPFCDEVKRLGNLIFSVSLEGTEESNDGRRGEGSYQEVMRAFDLMHKNGLLYGTSTAYTRLNTELVTSDEYFDTIISKGCRWAWYFHYMPVGEGANADLMPTIEQRKYMIDRIRTVRGYTGGKQIFAMDFQNDGEYVGGCIAGGRIFCHVNARGDVEPCVFIHYSNANIRDMSWQECLHQPIFQAYRENYPWNQNMLRPCPMLENPEILPRIVHEADAKSTEYVTPEDVDHLCARTAPYAKAWEPEGNRIWLEQHPTGKKEYGNDVSGKSPKERAERIEADDKRHEAVLS